MRRVDDVQPDDLLERHECLVGAESVAVQLLVLHHELQPLSDGDLQPRLGATAIRVLYVRDPDPLGRERAGTDSGQTTFAASGLGMEYRGMGRVGDHHQCLRQPLALPTQSAELPQREFMRWLQKAERIWVEIEPRRTRRARRILNRLEERVAS